jgi:DNA-binding Lrp family transcriptional regulator
MKAGAEAASLVAAYLEMGLPIVQEPFSAAADELGLSPGFVISTAQALSQSGLLRKFGAFWDFRVAGLQGYLFGVVAHDKTAETAEWINSLGFVTHNYLRRHELNIWFTAILPGERDAIELADELDGRDIPFVALAVVHRIKLRTSFAGTGERKNSKNYKNSPNILHEVKRVMPPRECEVRSHCFSAPQKNIIALLGDDLAIAPRPFTKIADLLEIDEDTLIVELTKLRSAGVLRRIGASFDHKRAGFSANSLMAWNFTGSKGDAETVVSPLPWVSHCYLRRLLAQNLRKPWTQNLFIMAHARDKDELEERERFLSSTFAPRNFVSMRTLKEYKKTSFRFTSWGYSPANSE